MISVRQDRNSNNGFPQNSCSSSNISSSRLMEMGPSLSEIALLWQRYRHV